MADFFLSYSHDSVGDALRLHQELETRSRTVWMDDALEASGSEVTSGLPAGIGVPSGQPHWDITSAAIADSATFLVSLDHTWPTKEYCIRELGHALSLGRRIAVVGDTARLCTLPEDARSSLERVGFVVGSADDIDAMLVELRSGDAAAWAQVRLAGEASGTWGLKTPLAFTRESVQDAETVLSGGAGVAFPNFTSADHERAATILVQASRKRSLLLGVGIALLAVLTVATGMSVVAWQASVRDRDTAIATAKSAEALRLADQSEQTNETLLSLRLAERAIQLEDSPRSHEALAAARYQAGRVKLSYAPPRNYASVAISPNGDRVALSHNTNANFGLVIVDTYSGTTTEFRAKQPIGDLEFTDSGWLVGVQILQTGTVAVSLSESDGSATVLSRSGVKALRRDDDGVIVGYSDGSLTRINRGKGETSIAQLGAAVVALDVTSDGILAYTSSGMLAHFARSAGGFAPEPDWESDLATAQFPTESDLWVDGDVIEQDGLVVPGLEPGSTLGTDWLRVCGDQIHLVVTYKSSGLLRGRYVPLDLRGRPIGGVAGLLDTLGLACSTESTSAWAVGALRTQTQALPARSWAPAGILDSRDRMAFTTLGVSSNGAHVAVAHWTGDIQLLVDPPLKRTIGRGRSVLPVTGGLVVADDQGRLALIDDQGSHGLGRLPSAPTSGDSSPSTAFFATSEGVYAVDGSGIRLLADMGGAGRLRLSRDGRELLVPGKEVTALNPDDGSRRTFTPPDLDPFESVYEFLLDGDRLITSTTYGRIIATTASGTVISEAHIGIAGPHPIAFGPNGGYVGAGQDGFLRLLDRDLGTVTTRLVGSASIDLASTHDRSRVILTSGGEGETTVWNAENLTRQGVLATGYQAQEGVRFSPDDRYAFWPSGTRASTAEWSVTRAPLP